MTEHKSLETLATPAELTKYADVLVNCALGHGHGIQSGEVVLVNYSQSGAILVPYLQKSITAAGGHMLHEADIIFPPQSDPEKILAEHGTEEQLSFLPLEHKKVLYDLADHKISLYTNEFALDPDSTNVPNMQERTRVANQSTALKLDYKNIFKSYTVAYAPSLTLAQNSQTTLEVFWKQIVRACYLDQDDAVEKCRDIMIQTKEVEDSLNDLKVRTINMKGENCDLNLTLTPEARFRSSAGGNMPSFECFVTPAASQTNGFIRFSYPLIYKGRAIKDVEVHFENGEAVSWTASEGLESFTDMMNLPNMKRLGEFALTDKRLSRIDTVLPSATLFLENIGGTAHVAFGNGYKKCFANKNNTPDFNEASDHKDMVINGDFTVTVTTEEGKEVIIFKEGQFTFF